MISLEHTVRYDYFQYCINSGGIQII